MRVQLMVHRPRTFCVYFVGGAQYGMIAASSRKPKVLSSNLLCLWREEEEAVSSNRFNVYVRIYTQVWLSLYLYLVPHSIRR